MLKKYLFLLCYLFVIQSVDVFSQANDSLRGTLLEVQVRTKFNPALRIVKKAIENRKNNSPYANECFSWNSYQKLIFTANIEKDSLLIARAAALSDSLSNNSDSLTRSDSSYLRLVQFFEKSHLFFMESVSKKFYKKPDHNSEKVIAHRTAGINDPIIAVYLANLQSFDFYEKDFVNIFGANFVNPVSAAALSLYEFTLKERIISDADTLFVIDFQPKKRVNFKSLLGTLFITSNNFALTKITAKPFDKKLNMAFYILQLYEKQKNSTYFPLLMKLQLELPSIQVQKGSVRAKSSIFSEIHITNIDFETKIKSKRFGIMEFSEDLLPPEKQIELLNLLRKVDLTLKEINTIKYIDTLSKKNNVNKKLDALQILMTGSIPIKKINFDFFRFINFNGMESVRLGLGLTTNDRLSKVVSVGGFFGYGFKDKTWKWGGNLDFSLMRSRNLKLIISYYSDLMESGGNWFQYSDIVANSTEYYRSWLFQKMYRSNALQLYLQSQLTRSLTFFFSTSYSNNAMLFDYSFSTNQPQAAISHYSFDDFYAKIGVRLAFKEKNWGSNKFRFNSGSIYPIIYLQYRHGFKGFINSDFAYNRVDLKVSYKKEWKILGASTAMLYASFVDRALPYPLLLNQRTNYYIIGSDLANHFGAMRTNEFFSDKFVTLFLRHNFGRMTQNKKFSPRIIISQGIGFGWLKNPEFHQGVSFSTMEKGYFETGLVIADLVVIKKLVSLGVGVFARYGAYYLPKPTYKTIDNFAFKVSIRLPFDR